MHFCENPSRNWLPRLDLNEFHISFHKLSKSSASYAHAFAHYSMSAKIWQNIMLYTDFDEPLVLYKLLDNSVCLDITCSHGDKDDILENDNNLNKVGDKKVTRVTRQKS